MLTLDEVILAFESIMADDDYHVDVYYNLESKTIEYVTDDDDSFTEYDEEDIDSDDHRIYLTTDLDDRGIIRDFVLSHENAELSKMFRLVFHGRGKFSRIKELFADFNILEDYYRYRDVKVTEEAKRWLLEHHIPYTL